MLTKFFRKGATHDHRTTHRVLVAAVSCFSVLVLSAQAVTLEVADKLAIARALNGALAAELRLMNYRAMSESIKPAELLSLEMESRKQQQGLANTVQEISKRLKLDDKCRIDVFDQEIKCESK